MIILRREGNECKFPLGQNSLKDEWEDLKAELATAKQKYKPESDDARSSKRTEAKVDRDNITDSDEERLLADFIQMVE